MEKSAVKQAADALRLWSNAWNEFDKTGKNKPASIEEVIEPFIQMEKEQIINAWEDGKGSFSTRQPEQYYKETFTSTPQGETPSATRIGQS